MDAETNTKAVNLNVQGLKIGVALGLINVILYLLIYVVNPTMFGSFLFGLITLLVMIVILIFISRFIRKVNGGFISFGQLFKSLLITLTISSLIGASFNFVLNTVIDPQLPTTIKESVKQRTFNMLQSFNLSEDEIDKAMEKIDEKDYSPSFKNSSGQLLGILIFSAIIALIYAAIFKKKKENNYEALLDSSGTNKTE